MLAGIVLGVLSLTSEGLIVSSLLGVTAFSCFWSILELKQQKERVRKGWFPEGPGHNK